MKKITLFILALVGAIGMFSCQNEANTAALLAKQATEVDSLVRIGLSAARQTARQECDAQVLAAIQTKVDSAAAAQPAGTQKAAATPPKPGTKPTTKPTTSTGATTTTTTVVTHTTTTTTNQHTRGTDGQGNPTSVTDQKQRGTKSEQQIQQIQQTNPQQIVNDQKKRGTSGKPQ